MVNGQIPAEVQWLTRYLIHISHPFEGSFCQRITLGHTETQKKSTRIYYSKTL